MSNEIVVDGVTYIKKECESNYKIVRGDRSGVFFGKFISRIGREVILEDVRRIWYWEGASSLSQLAEYGTSAPGNCKFPCKVNRIEVLDVIEILDVTDKAKKSIDGVEVWSQ